MNTTRTTGSSLPKPAAVTSSTGAGAVPQKNAAPATAAEKNAPAESDAAEALVELQVWSVPAVNRALVICHRPDQDGSNPMNLVSVQVRENTNFLKAMKLKARPISANRFILEGPCPRWRGKW